MIAHPAIAAFTRDAASLSVGSIPVDRLAERVGSTPFFAYDRGMLTRRIGDLIALFQAGAYGLTASPTAFLSHAAPTEVLI